MKKMMRYIAFTLLIAASVQAANKTWVGTVDGNWGTAGNWTGGVPVAGDRAYFSSASPVRTTAVLDTDYTLNSGALTPALMLYFNSAYNYTINGPGKLTLETTYTANSQNMMNIGAGAAGTTQTINSDLILNTAGSHRISTDVDSHYVFNGNVAFQKTAMVRLLNLNSTATFNGGVSVDSGAIMNVYGGTINLKSRVQGAGLVSIQGQGRGTLVVLDNASGAAFDSSLSRVSFGAAVDTGYATTIRQDVDDQVDGAVNLGVATWDLNGQNNKNTGKLALSSTTGLTGIIDFSDIAAEALWFDDSRNELWNTEILNLVGFDFDTDELRFGTTANGLTAQQLSQIRIDGAVVDNLTLDSSGFLVIPEPATIGMLGLGALVTLVLRRMHR